MLRHHLQGQEALQPLLSRSQEVSIMVICLECYSSLPLQTQEKELRAGTRQELGMENAKWHVEVEMCIGWFWRARR